MSFDYDNEAISEKLNCKTMLRFLKTILLTVLIFSISGGEVMSIPLQKVILKSTVYIKNSFGNVGTGF